ncbi:MAG: GerMN domain-containing protein, partial [Lachnospiraceae bacterium]|nr:GerMN domain-containing protein [Lachnospiraceae bacterium]
MSEGNFRVYYPDKDNVKVMPVGYDMSEQDTGRIIEEALRQLSLQPSDYELRAAIPENVPVNSVGLTDGLLLIDFGTEYLRNAGREEILRRAAIVRTLDQIEGVDEITFTIDGAV